MNSQSAKIPVKRWIIVSIIVIVLAGVAFGFYWPKRTYLNAYYHVYIFKKRLPIKPGDKLFLPRYLVDDSSSKTFARYDQKLYRVIRPLNNDEIDAMDITLAEKALRKQDLSLKKPYMFETIWAISTDSLCKYKSAFVSRYNNSKIADLYFGEGEYLPQLFFEVHPVRKSMVRTDYFDKMPSGYKFEDNTPFFLEASDLSPDDSKTFRIIK